LSETELSTDHLRLRRFTESDAEDLFNLDADPAVMRFITGGAGTPRETIERQILPRFIREQDQAGVFGFWAAEQPDGFVGWFSLRPIDGLPGDAALGYRLRQPSWGQGLATEVCRLLVDRGFRLGNLERIVATTYEDNLASIRVMQKLGMRFERRFHMDAASIAAMDTADADPANAFPGADVEYVIDRRRWLATEQIG
jgi:RimJ/RimL family protein N-acetyltransferase